MPSGTDGLRHPQRIGPPANWHPLRPGRALDVRSFVSAASAWEIATQQRLGKLEGVPQVSERYAELVAADGFQHLAIDHRHALGAGCCTVEHRDPFDRMLAAQSELERLPLVTRTRRSRCSEPRPSGVGAGVIRLYSLARTRFSASADAEPLLRRRRDDGPVRGHRRVGLWGRRSERQVWIEVRRPTVGHELIPPGLLSLRPVDRPDGLAHGLQDLEHGQRLLGRPVGGHRERCRRPRRRAHEASLRERDAVLRAARSALRATSRSSASFCR